MQRYDLYVDDTVKLEAEIVQGSAYLHCKVLKKFTIGVYKRFLVVFTAAMNTLHARYAAVRALIPVADRKLARFAEMFGLGMVQYVPKQPNWPAYYIYEVQKWATR
jgi:hypothetical protein